MTVQSSSPAYDNLVASSDFLEEDEVKCGIEMLYFGYTRLTKNIDDMLEEQGLGRAHHRALYFIARQPDLTVSDLLRLLAITKQSLGRVLNDLSDRGLVETRRAKADKRRKLLRLTGDGEKLEAQLFDALREKVAAAYEGAGRESVTGFWRVLQGLIPPQDRPMVAALKEVSS